MPSDNILTRKATMIPSYLGIRFKENKLSLTYKVHDNGTRKNVGDVFINFEPSDQLMTLLKSEVESAIKANF